MKEKIKFLDVFWTQGYKHSFDKYQVRKLHPTFVFRDETSKKYYFLNLTTIKNEKLSELDYVRYSDDKPVIFKVERFTKGEVRERRLIMMYSIAVVDESYIVETEDIEPIVGKVSFENRYCARNYLDFQRRVLKKILFESDDFYFYNGNPDGINENQTTPLTLEFLSAVKEKLKDVTKKLKALNEQCFFHEYCLTTPSRTSTDVFYLFFRRQCKL